MQAHQRITAPNILFAEIIRVGHFASAAIPHRTGVVCAAVLLLFLSMAGAQQPAVRDSNHQTLACGTQVRSTYLLGPDDDLEISGPELDEISKNVIRIDGNGDIQLPLIGRVHVAGLTVRECEQKLNKRLSTYIRDPQVSVNLKELRSQPVSVLGAVNTPGVHQLSGHKTLLEMLALAGGLRPDAGYSIRITRRAEWGCLPIADATLDSSGQFSVADLNLKKMMEAVTPAQNIQILPYDVITIPKAELVYVIGDVKRSGGFALGQDESISVLQALSLAEGLTNTADAKHARILRVNSSTKDREEIPVNVKGILSGKRDDLALRGDDILFIPGSTGKKVALRSIEAAIQTGTGLAIWRR